MFLRIASSRGVQLGLAMILLIAIIEKWGFYFGFNLKFYECVVIAWIPFALVFAYARSSTARVPQPLFTVLLLKWLYFELLLFSFFPLLFSSGNPENLAFFAKGILQSGVRTCFFSVLILTLVALSAAQRQRLFLVHLIAVSLSALYGLLQAAMMHWRQTDLDGVISGWLAPFTGNPGPDISRFAYGSFYRLPGLAGDPNLHAAYALTAVPVLLTLFLSRPRWYFGLPLGIHAAMIVLTQSLSGIGGLIVAIGLVLVLRHPRVKPGHLPYMALSVVVAVAVFLRYQEQITHLFLVRTDPAGTSSQHSEIAREALRIYRNAPLGVGYNNFSLAWRAYSTMYPDRAMNPHNTYLAILVESGPLALFCELATYGFIAWIAWRKRTPFARIFLACLAGMCVAALAYETLEMFYAQMFVFLGFTCVVMGDRLWFDRQPHPVAAAKLQAPSARAPSTTVST